jgi:hypothetical protein
MVGVYLLNLVLDQRSNRAKKTITKGLKSEMTVNQIPLI